MVGGAKVLYLETQAPLAIQTIPLTKRLSVFCPYDMAGQIVEDNLRAKLLKQVGVHINYTMCSIVYSTDNSGILQT